MLYIHIKNTRTNWKLPPLLFFFFVSGFLLDFLFLNEPFLLKFLLIYVKSSEGPLPSHNFLGIKFFVRIFEDIKNKVFLSDLIVFVCIADFGKMLSSLHTMLQKKNSALGKNKIIWKFKTFMALYHDFCKIQS